MRGASILEQDNIPSTPVGSDKLKKILMSFLIPEFGDK
jgi:hypothetical protein